MLRKIKFVSAYLWLLFMAFTAPICTGLIFMDITGHSKGYSYHLGSEADISIMSGVFELLIWFLMVIPCGVYVLKRVRVYGAKYIFATLIMMILFVVCIHLSGGWGEYLSYFNITFGGTG